MADPPRHAPVLDERRTADHDAEDIGASDGREPGVEILIDPSRRRHGDRMRAQMRVEGAGEPERGPVAREVDMRDLAGRVDAGVGAPGAGDEGGRRVDAGGGGLERALDARAVGLALPAAERTAVIFEAKGVAGHGRMP